MDQHHFVEKVLTHLFLQYSASFILWTSQAGDTMVGTQVIERPLPSGRPQLAAG